MSIPEFDPVPVVDECRRIEAEYERLNELLVAARAERIRMVAALDKKVGDLSAQIYTMRRKVAAARERARLGGG